MNYESQRIAMAELEGCKYCRISGLFTKTGKWIRKNKLHGLDLCMSDDTLPKISHRAFMTLESDFAAPLLASLIARELVKHGAKVTLEPGHRIAEKSRHDLTGLHIHIGRTVWVRKEQLDSTFPKE